MKNTHSHDTPVNIAAVKPHFSSQSSQRVQTMKMSITIYVSDYTLETILDTGTLCHVALYCQLVPDGWHLALRNKLWDCCSGLILDFFETRDKSTDLQRD